MMKEEDKKRMKEKFSKAGAKASTTTEAEKYLENHELYSDIMHWKHISIIMKDYKDSLLEQIEKSLNFNLMEEGNCYEDGYNDGIQSQSYKTQEVINKLKKGCEE